MILRPVAPDPGAIDAAAFAAILGMGLRTFRWLDSAGTPPANHHNNDVEAAR